MDGGDKPYREKKKKVLYNKAIKKKINILTHLFSFLWYILMFARFFVISETS